MSRNANEITYWCGTCPAILETLTADHDEAHGIMRYNGWVLTGGEHFCSNCKAPRLLPACHSGSGYATVARRVR